MPDATPPPPPPPASIAIAEFVGVQRPGKFPVDDLAALEKRSFSRADAWSATDLAAAAAKPNALFLVGRDEGGGGGGASTSTPVLGYLAGTTTGSSIHIARVAVQPGARRRGVAAQLVQAALQPEMGATRRRRPLGATLHVDPANAPARALYSKVGFTEEGLLAGYYAPGRDAVRMVADLGGG